MACLTRACLLANSVTVLPAQLGSIFYFIVLPMLLLVAIGYAIQRRLGLDMATLVRLNFYFIVPGIIYYSVVNSPLTAADAGLVVSFHLAAMLALGMLTLGLVALRGVARDQRRAMLMGVLFYNSGNYGLPLQHLAFRGQGLGDAASALQVFVMITQNLVSFTLGVLLATGGGDARQLKRNLLHIARFPPIYALAAALLTIAVRRALGDHQAADLAHWLSPFWIVVEQIGRAFVAVALATLGAQLALVVKDQSRRYPVRWTVFLRLLVGPAVGLGLIYAFGVSGFMAQVLLISCATPTAVNAMLLCIEFDNHPDFLARSVFYSTLLSPLTVTAVIFFAQGGFLTVLQP